MDRADQQRARAGTPGRARRRGGAVLRILAIDPGTTESGWADVEDGRVLASGKAPNPEVFFGQADLVAVEMVASYGMPVGREVFEACVWIGRFLERAGDTPTVLVYRRDVKLHFCGSARANDATIRQALIDRYGPGRELAIGTKKYPGPLYGVKGDAWAALAVALYAGDRALWGREKEIA